MRQQATTVQPSVIMISILALITLPLIQTSPIKISSEVTGKAVIQIPRFRAEEPDAYMCMAVPATDIELKNVVGYKVEVIKEITHHISVAFCEDYETNQPLWDCKNHHGDICSGRSIAFGGWDGYSGHHKDTWFPDDVGIQFGKDLKLNYIVIQMHLEEAVLDPSALKSNPANITLFLTEQSRKYSYQKVNLFSYGYIPPFSEDFKAELTYKWEGSPINAYEYFAHTHAYGYLLEGYIVRNNTIIFSMKENTQEKKQDMTPVEGGLVEIRPGDVLALRCSYRNPGQKNITFGLKGGDEMCNLIYNFKYDAKDIDAFPRSIKSGADVQDRVWCPKDGIGQVDVLCDMQQAASVIRRPRTTKYSNVI
ncbi:hypothetical protein ACJMK2_028204 [Sinanodonta woodiana]|uniref:Peptidylglycine monooxygenase n=1 Tax=Sinanodonta woodiana TaxID=1069815 RepID=A0ABD3X9W4_SINWO